MICLPLYVPHSWHTVCGSLLLPHSGQVVSIGAVNESWERRALRRALDTRFLGTGCFAMLFLLLLHEPSCCVTVVLVERVLVCEMCQNVTDARPLLAEVLPSRRANMSARNSQTTILHV